MWRVTCGVACNWLAGSVCLCVLGGGPRGVRLVRRRLGPRHYSLRRPLPPPPDQSVYVHLSISCTHLQPNQIQPFIFLHTTVIPWVVLVNLDINLDRCLSALDFVFIERIFVLWCFLLVTQT